VLFALLVCASSADQTYDKTSKANRLYEQGKYDEALELYNEALIENPEAKKLAANKGSALHRLGNYDEAVKSYQEALSIEDKQALAATYYNLGNTLVKKGDELHGAGDPSAMEQYKQARQNYIQSLDLKPHDTDTKWNLQLVQKRIEELKQQQQQQQQQNEQDKNKQDKDKNKDQQQDKNRQQNKDNQEQQDKNRQKEQNEQQDQQQQQQDEQRDRNQDQNHQQQQQQEGDRQDEQKPRPRPGEQREDMEKQEARRLLQQYADDEDQLNKPRREMKTGKTRDPERDW
jgi:Ca-activated chloride channel family protein